MQFFGSADHPNSESIQIFRSHTHRPNENPFSLLTLRIWIYNNLTNVQLRCVLLKSPKHHPADVYFPRSCMAQSPQAPIAIGLGGLWFLASSLPDSKAPQVAHCAITGAPQTWLRRYQPVNCCA
jgi:hypothetical protein